jgi:hypothetical protein
MEVGLPLLTYRETDVAAQTLRDGTLLDEQAVVRWMQGAGVVRTPAIDAEAAELVGQTHVLAAIVQRGESPTTHNLPPKTLFNGRMQGTSSGYIMESGIWSAVIVWSLGWVIGLLGYEWGVRRGVGRRDLQGSPVSGVAA